MKARFQRWERVTILGGERASLLNCSFRKEKQNRNTETNVTDIVSDLRCSRQSIQEKHSQW